MKSARDRSGTAHGTLEPAPFQLLYVSGLAPGCDYEVMKDIVATVRQHGREHGLTGGLLFDGERFCQLIEGAEADVRALLRCIETDARHVEVRLLFEGVAPAGRLTERVAVGYCEPGDLAPFDAVAALPGAAVLAMFVALLERADVD